MRERAACDGELHLSELAIEVERTADFCSLDVTPWPVPDWLRRTDKLLRCHSAYPVDRVRDVQSFNRLQIMRIDETRMRQVRKASMLHTTLIPVSCGTPSMSNPP
jgi:hypothetical protein